MARTNGTASNIARCSRPGPRCAHGPDGSLQDGGNHPQLDRPQPTPVCPPLSSTSTGIPAPSGPDGRSGLDSGDHTSATVDWRLGCYKRHSRTGQPSSPCPLSANKRPLTPGTVYYFQVRAVNDINGDEALSPKPPAASQPPSQPVGTSR